MLLDDFIKEFSKNEGKINKGSILGSIPHGSEALIISKISQHIKKDILFVCENKKKYNQIKDVLNFLEIENTFFFPEYDTNFYDRISPNKNITSERVKTLAELNTYQGNKIVLTTAKASTQFIADKKNNYYKNINLRVGIDYDTAEIKSFLVENGYTNTSYVREVGEFAVRGGIIDFFPFNSLSPVRLDFFGNKLDLIRSFNANTQLSDDKCIDSIDLFPCEEIILNNELVRNLLSINGVEGIFLGGDFITINKYDDIEWEEIKHIVISLINDFYSSGKECVIESNLEERFENLEDIEKKIIQILNQKIRPAVAKDGGDIKFKEFKDGVVKVQLQGSCSGCPSSTMTLKQGVQNLLCHYIPEVKQVEAI